MKLLFKKVKDIHMHVPVVKNIVKTRLTASGKSTNVINQKQEY